MSIRDDIFSEFKTPQSELPREPVHIFNRDVFARTMTGAEKDAFEIAVYDGRERGEPNIRANLLVRTLCNDQGERIFTNADAEDFGNLLPGAELDKAFEQAKRLNAIGEDDEAELQGNS